ncbi:hypothetical protein [Winogradskyella luteola]|nr:hypothetical protein [Winogradskyella luteola]
MDNSFDTTIFFDINEEEEKESVKLLFETASLDLEDFYTDRTDLNSNSYTFKAYSKPHLNLVFPPPEKILG